MVNPVPPVAFTWDPDRGLSAAAAGPSTARLAAADSFLVADGKVRGWDAHWARFGAACTEVGAELAALRPFQVAVAAALSSRGRWFPSVELRQSDSGEPELWLHLRRAPAREAEAVVWAMPAPAPHREAPRRKGPDLARLGLWRGEARSRGADEALLLDDDDRILEGAYTSVLWWEDEVLWAVPDDAPILPGITRALLIEVARTREVAIRFRRPRPAELSGREMWLTSALHGVRRVSGWLDPSLAAGDDGRAETWQAALDALAQPLPT